MRIACLLPRKDMVERAWRVLMKNGVDWQALGLTIDYGPKFYALEWVEKIKSETPRPDIIVARGLHATLIKQHCTIPLVEIRLTAQEMGLLVVQALKMVHKAHPRIGVVGYMNQYCNMDRFDEIFDIELHSYLVQDDISDIEALYECARQAVRDKMDVIIGGDVAQEIAQQGEIPNLYIQSTGDSFWEAFLSVKRMAYAIELEQLNSSRLQTLLDNAFSTVVCLNVQGRVTMINQIAEMQLGWAQADVQGQPLSALVPGLGMDVLMPVLTEGRTVFSVYIDIGPRSMVANISPILTENGIAGAVLSAQPVKLVEEMGSAVRRHQMGKYSFTGASEEIGEPSAAMRRTEALCRQYAGSEFPVLIFSDPGNLQHRFAQLIHRTSRRERGEFIYADCTEIPAADQIHALFGSAEENGSILRAANGGTLYLENIQVLAPPCQRRLLSVLKHQSFMDARYRQEPISVRIVASAPVLLAQMAEEGRFDAELYYALHTLPLSLPPLRERKEDILYWAEQFLAHYRERYKRYIALTAGGKRQLTDYPWNGNVVQLRAFCQHLILTAQRRTIDEVDIRRLYGRMYFAAAPAPAAQAARESVRTGGEAERISRLLAQYNGNRSRTAAALDISTTTLWRKIKKYGLTDDALTE